MHLRHPGITYSACGPFTENEERMQKFGIHDIFINMN